MAAYRGTATGPGGGGAGMFTAAAESFLRQARCDGDRGTGDSARDPSGRAGVLAGPPGLSGEPGGGERGVYRPSSPELTERARDGGPRS